MALRSQVEKRQRAMEKKVGRGLEDRDYQRHVGRIAECEAQLTAINEMMRADSDEITDALEEEKSEQARSQRNPPSNRRGK
jgi:protein-arginine kinase activator protein McsA